jgi:hypothetical protein
MRVNDGETGRLKYMPKPLPRNKAERRALQDYNAERQRACRRKKKDAAQVLAERLKRAEEMVMMERDEMIRQLRPGEESLALLTVHDHSVGKIAIVGTPYKVCCHNFHGMATLTIERIAEAQ